MMGGHIEAMKKAFAFILIGFVILAGSPANGQSLADRALRAPSHSTELEPYFRSETYAREVSGTQIYGDAHTWWEQARGRYPTGKAPRRGAIMAFRPHRSLHLGHVATVRQVVDNRTVLLDHANWSPVDGRRGQIERNAWAVDVSPDNDWSAVRVWYQPLGRLGRTVWPVEGFIFSDRAREAPKNKARASTRGEEARSLLDAFKDLID